MLNEEQGINDKMNNIIDSLYSMIIDAMEYNSDVCKKLKSSDGDYRYCCVYTGYNYNPLT